jgi:hypothetical protein
VNGETSFNQSLRIAVAAELTVRSRLCSRSDHARASMSVDQSPREPRILPHAARTSMTAAHCVIFCGFNRDFMVPDDAMLLPSCVPV